MLLLLSENLADVLGDCVLAKLLALLHSAFRVRHRRLRICRKLIRAMQSFPGLELADKNCLKRAVLLAFLLSVTLLASQTQITPPDNKYTPAQDVELGLQAAAEARQQLPVMRDDAVTSYIEDIGRRLTAAVPGELRHPEFRYSFEAVNVRGINAFAL